MTTMNEATEAVYGKFITDWAAATAVTFDDEEFDPEAEGGNEWVRVTVRHRPSDPQTIGRTGNRRYDRVASVIVQIYTDVKTHPGRAQADARADAVKNIFEGIRLGGLVFYEADWREIGADGRWYQLNVEVPFSYEEQR